MSDADGGTVDIIVPQVGEAIADVTLVRWLKQVGETVSKGDPLFEVDTEKATFEIEAFADGVLVDILASAGSSVSPLQVVARLALAGAELSPSNPATSPLVAPSSSDPVAPEMPSIRRDRRRGPSATPRARGIAAELGVDLENVVGTGEQGMITAHDVEQGAGDGAGSLPRAESPRVEPMPAAKATVARRVQESKRNVPHFYLQADIDMSAVESLRDRIRSDEGSAPTVTGIVIRACAHVIAANPSLNVSYKDGGIEHRNRVGIGVAVDTDVGLLVPVIGDAHSLSLAETSARLLATIERARAGRLWPEDAMPKSLVVSNLGMHGVDAFFAIIDEPDPLILSVGRTTKRVVAIEDAPQVRPVATFGLSIDHRVLDGVDGARFLTALRELLESADHQLESEQGS